jgi:hypothetical protein
MIEIANGKVLCQELKEVEGREQHRVEQIVRFTASEN